MKFGSGRINLLQQQTNREEFVASYDKLTTQTLTSNYRNGVRFETLNIKLSESDLLMYNFDQAEWKAEELPDNIVLSGLYLDDISVDEIDFTLRPYVLWCNMYSNEHTGSLAQFTLLVAEQKQYCFEIKNHTCKITAILCP